MYACNEADFAAVIAAVIADETAALPAAACTAPSSVSILVLTESVMASISVYATPDPTNSLATAPLKVAAALAFAAVKIAVAVPPVAFATTKVAAHVVSVALIAASTIVFIFAADVVSSAAAACR